MVRELDMTPTAYMDIPGPGRYLRITPRTIAVNGHSHASVSAAGYSIINRVMAEIERRIGIVWWRKYPEVSFQDAPHPDANMTAEEREDWHPYQFRCRLATSPELPDTFWEPISKKEGERIKLTTAKVWAMLRDPLAGEESELYSEEADFGPEFNARLGLHAYTEANMARLRKTTLNGQEPDFGCAQYVPPGVEVLGQTPIVGTLENAKQISKTSSLHGGGKPQRRVRKAKRHPAKRRARLQ